MNTPRVVGLAVIIGGVGYLMMRRSGGNGFGLLGTPEAEGSLALTRQELDEALANPMWRPEDQALIDQLIEGGAVEMRPSGPVARPDASQSERSQLARAECQRAVDDFGVPPGEQDECQRVVEAGRTFSYQPPGARYTVKVSI